MDRRPRARALVPLASLAAVAGWLGALEGAAHAQAPGQQPGQQPAQQSGQQPGQQSAVPAVPDAPAAPVQAEEARSRWSVGLRATGMELAAADDPEATTSLGGLGLHLRYRLARRWSLELAVDRLAGELGPYTRTATPISLGAQLHLTPDSRWSWYLLGALGVTADELSIDGEAGEPMTYRQGHAHLGVGLERLWRRWGFGIELRAVGMARDDGGDGDAAGERSLAMDGPIPVQSSGGQIDAFVSYHF